MAFNVTGRNMFARLYRWNVSPTRKRGANRERKRPENSGRLRSRFAPRLRVGLTFLRACFSTCHSPIRILLVIGTVAAPGCSKSDPYGREPVSGTVRFHGEPIPKANILFSNMDGQHDFDSGAMIQDGSFNIQREFGPIPGRYCARISLLQLAGGKEGPKEALAPGAAKGGVGKTQQMIPAPYSTEGVIVDVRAGAPNQFDFDIP